jgi:hypothetical protein
MINMDVNNLKRFNLSFPGNWINSEERDQAFQTQHILGLIQDLFTEAVAAHALFRPITAENVHDYINRDKSPYESCLNGLYAKAFVFALDGIEKLLNRLSMNLNPPQEVKRLHEEYKRQFGHLKHMRDSAIHIEDRGRGVTRHQKPLNTHVIVIGCFIERRFTFTGEDGNQYEVEICEATLNKAKAIIQDIINSYSWS